MNLKRLVAVVVVSVSVLGGVSFFGSSQAQAKPAISGVYSKGSVVKAFEAKDKNGANYKFKKGTEFLIISADMKSGKKANVLLNAKGAAYLDNKKAVFIVSIYAMPKVGRMFALPRMKRYAHPIVYADNKTLLAPFPQVKGKLTVLMLDSNAQILKVSYWDPAVAGIDAILK